MFSTAEKVRKCSFISEPSFYIHLLFLLEKKYLGVAFWKPFWYKFLVLMATRQLHFGRRLAELWESWQKQLPHSMTQAHPLQFWVRLLHPTEYSSNKHRAILDFLLSTVPIYLFSHQPNPGNLVQQLLTKHAEMQSDPVILRLKLKKQMMVSCRVWKPLGVTS